MHECPECQRVCDCDGEDTWHSAGSAVDDCTHECEDDDDEDLEDEFCDWCGRSWDSCTCDDEDDDETEDLDEEEDA